MSFGFWFAISFLAASLVWMGYGMARLVDKWNDDQRSRKTVAPVKTSGTGRE